MEKQGIKLVIIVVILLAGVVAQPVGAQGGEELTCDDTQISAAIEQAQTDLTAAAGLTGPEALAALAAVKLNLAAVETSCNGLTLSGEAGAVFGPVEIPAGYYRVTASGSGISFFLEGTLIEGECGGGYGETFQLFMYLDSSFAGGPFEEEALMPSDGCSVLWEASEITAPFTVTFEKLK